MIGKGYIKTHRQLLGSDIWESGDLALGRVWDWCMMKASYKNYQAVVGNEVVPLQPGQFVCGELKGATECVIPPSTFRKKLLLLEKLHSISLIRKRTHTTVTLLNWGAYQSDGSATEVQQKHSGSTAEDIQEGKEGKEREGVSPTPHTRGFTSPSKMAVAEYAKQYRDRQRYNVNDATLMGWCAAFFDKYTGQGWKKGNGQKITDWTAVLREWITSNTKRLTQKGNQ